MGTAYKTSKPDLYGCVELECRKDLTVTVGRTVFERSKIALHKGLLAVVSAESTFNDMQQSLIFVGIIA
jgi:hypothetical protein